MSKRLKYAWSCAWLLCASTTIAAEPAESKQGASVVLVLDVSSSMLGAMG
jgi:hypothetical protein